MSKVRIIWKQGLTSIFPGASAIAQLRAIAKANYIEPPSQAGRSRWQYAVELERRLRAAKVIANGHQLLIYREPRKVRAKNSRYRQTLNTIFGTVARPTPPRGGRGARPRPTAHHPKPKRPSRTVNLLEQELLRKGDDF